ncbi:MAG: tRNA (adenosine(37)-N6)-threonylcarbamoyltransferase complex ATPase subunit type 1 TsaE [Pseudomonadota bacterium]
MLKTTTTRSPEQTAAVAQRIAATLGTGDTLLMSGPVGAGKSLFCRALIETLQRQADEPPEDIPSPSYTLIQTYRAGPLEIWHADLYRLGDASELVELGLDEAFASVLALIEWPDRLGEMTPQRSLTLDLQPDPDFDQGRRITLSPKGAGWTGVIKAAVA